MSESSTFIDRYSKFIGYLDQTYPLTDIHPHDPQPMGQRVLFTYTPVTLHTQTQLKEEGLLKGPEGNMSKKIKSIMIIHIAKTRAQVKSV